MESSVENIKRNERNNDEIGTSGKRRGGRNKNSETTKEENGRTTNNSIDGRRNGRRKQEIESNEEKKSVGLVDVKKPIDVEINVPVVEKPKRKYTKRKVKEETKEEKILKASDVSMLLSTVSTVVASKKGMEHWKISEKESMMIAEPLTNILEKSSFFNKVAEHSDGIALVTACTVVFAPRVMMTVANIKINKGVKKDVSKFKPTIQRNESGKTTNSSGTNNNGNDGINATDGAIVGNEFSIVEQNIW